MKANVEGLEDGQPSAITILNCGIIVLIAEQQIREVLAESEFREPEKSGKMCQKIQRK